MIIDNAIIKNFTAFKNFEIDFSPGINVLIGENGTGKTHLLKLLYSFCKSSSNKSLFIGVEPNLSYSMFFNADSLFVNSKNDGWFRNKNETCYLTFVANGQKFAFKFDLTGDDNGVNTYGINYVKETFQSVFVPAKEMLTHSGLEKDYLDRKLPFDPTYIDIINKAGVSEKRELPVASKNIINKISEIIGGKILYENNMYFVVNTERKIEFSLEAEGTKKLGLIYRLLETGALDKGVILFWDEPETNINPKQIPFLVDVLLELEKTGIQIFIATHDYVFAKYLEIKRHNINSVRFHSLFKSDDGVICESNANFRDLKENPITRAYDILLDEVFEKNLGE